MFSGSHQETMGTDYGLKPNLGRHNEIALFL